MAFWKNPKLIFKYVFKNFRKFHFYLWHFSLSWAAVPPSWKFSDITKIMSDMSFPMCFDPLNTMKVFIWRFEYKLTPKSQVNYLIYAFWGIFGLYFGVFSTLGLQNLILEFINNIYCFKILLTINFFLTFWKKGFMNKPEGFIVQMASLDVKWKI